MSVIKKNNIVCPESNFVRVKICWRGSEETAGMGGKEEDLQG